MVSTTFFLYSETQKQEVFQGFLQENIPTPERSQESDFTCKGITLSRH